MKAAVMYEPNKPLVIEDVTINKPAAHEVLLRTAYAGLCHSDLHFIEGLYPHPVPVVLGHELAGIVEEVGSEVNYVKKGDHVITCLSVFCGTCDNCTTGRPFICTDTTVKMLPGVARRLSLKGQPLHTFTNLSSYAEMMLVHENALVKIGHDFPLDRAALIGCGVITGYGAAVNTAKVSAGETVAVIGCGGVGMAAINGAAIAGAGRVIAIDTNPVKLQLATKLGATDIINPRDGDPVQQIKDLMKGGVNHAIECLGTKATAEQAFNMLAPAARPPSSAWYLSGRKSSCTASTSCASAKSRAPRWAPTDSAWTCRGSFNSISSASCISMIGFRTASSFRRSTRALPT